MRAAIIREDRETLRVLVNFDHYHMDGEGDDPDDMVFAPDEVLGGSADRVRENLKKLLSDARKLI